MMTDWVYEVVQSLMYKLLEALVSLTWKFDRGVLYGIDVIDRLSRALVTRGFTQALDAVSTTVLGVNRAVFELALALGLICYMLSPFRLQFVNIRKAIVLFVLVPVALPVIAGAFQDIEAARTDLSNSLYNTVYSRVNFNLIPPDSANGAEQDMGTITSFSDETDGVQGVRGVDIAAAYLFAKRSDVFNPTDSLPADFRQKYFFHPVGDFENMEQEERWQQIDTSVEGLVRTLYGMVLLAAAMIERLINLALLITMGLLMIALFLSVIFAYFSVFEGMFASTVKRLAETFWKSWLFSVIQALFMAALVSAAQSGNAIATLAAGCILIVVQVGLLFFTFDTVKSALTGGGSFSASAAASMAAAPLAAAGGAGGILAKQGMEASGELMQQTMKRTVVGAAVLYGVTRRAGSVVGQTLFPSSTPEHQSDYARSSVNGSSGASQSAGADGTDPTASPEPPSSASGMPVLGISDTVAAERPEAMGKLQQSLQRYPLPEPLAAALMIDMRGEGQFQPPRRAALRETLVQAHGLHAAQVDRHIAVLEGRMHALYPDAGPNPDRLAREARLGQRTTPPPAELPQEASSPPSVAAAAQPVGAEENR